MKTRPSIPTRWLSSMAPVVLLGLILSSTPGTVRADVLCTQFGFDTFQVGSTVEFEWKDNQAAPIGSFNLELFCFENGKQIKTLATLNTATSVSPQNWTVDNSILTFHNDCPLNVKYKRYILRVIFGENEGWNDWISGKADTHCNSEQTYAALNIFFRHIERRAETLSTLKKVDGPKNCHGKSSWTRECGDVDIGVVATPAASDRQNKTKQPPRPQLTRFL